MGQVHKPSLTFRAGIANFVGMGVITHVNSLLPGFLALLPDITALLPDITALLPDITALLPDITAKRPHWLIL
jgi:hypothetical protein